MTDRSGLLVRSLGLVMVISMTAGVAGCGDGNEDQPHGEEIKSIIEDLWDAAGVDVEQTNWSRYVRESKKGIGGCASLADEDEQWVAYRTSSGSAKPRGHEEVFDLMNDYLKDKGFQIMRHRIPTSDRLESRSGHGDVRVLLQVSRNAWTQMQVFAGPCGQFMADEPPDNGQPLD